MAFWHLTFQEFLAAKAIASRLEAEQRKILFADPEKIYLPEWREVILLLAGILHEQGSDKVDGFVGAVLDGWLRTPSWPPRPAARDSWAACCATCSRSSIRSPTPAI